MKIKSNRLTIALLLFSFSLLQFAVAKDFKDKGLEKGEVITLDSVFSETEIHGDSTITNEFPLGVAGATENHRGIWDYRLEAHTPLYHLGANKGRLITRVEGFAYFDEKIDNFFDDPLIDIPELLFENDTDITDDGKNILTTTFGKFANRRYLDRDQISPNSFDMGERPFFGAIANTNNLLNSMNENRDLDHAAAGTRMATGSYGFAFNYKNHNLDGNFLTSRWGLKQIFAVAQMDNFADNFYAASEVNKNWGSAKYAGQSSLGMVYGENDIFRTPGATDGSYLLYASVVQKFNKLTSYLRWGTMMTNNGVTDITRHEYRSGLLYQLTDKDLITTHLVYLDNDPAYGGPNNGIIWINFLRHQFNNNLIGWLYAVPKFNIPNASGIEDTNVTLGFELQALI